MTRFAHQGLADRGDAVVSWLAKISIILMLIGIVSFDAISTAVLRMQLQDAASISAKSAVNDTTTQLPTQRFAYESASATLASTHPEFSIDPASVIVGRDASITVTVEGEARTLVAGRISQLDRWTHSSATATARVSG